MKRFPSPPVTIDMAAVIKRLLGEGVLQHHIAGALKINQGRVSEINTGKRFKDIPSADQLRFDF